MSPTGLKPVVSVIVANHNGERFLASALRSVLRQTLGDFEVIVVDDASSDDSRRIALDLAAGDNRIRVLAREEKGGPGAARNVALAASRGTWVAILDGDDFMHPERLAALVSDAETFQADICADDLLVFGEGLRPFGLLSQRQRKHGWITLANFVASNTLYSNEPATGYLKPLIKLSFLRRHSIEYDTRLKIGEDFDLIAHALAVGAKFRLCDRLGYFYRKHELSMSHRLSASDLAQMLRADDRLKASLKNISPELLSAFERRQASIERALEFDNLIAALKSRAFGKACRTALRRPDVVPLLRLPILRRLRSFWPTHAAKAAGRQKQACLISRQRIIGATNGSSAYILGICKALRDDGYRLRLVSPNAGTFGRLPFIRLRPETSVFEQLALRGAWKFGRICIAKDPRIAFHAAKAILARFAKRFGISLAGWDSPAAYVIGTPWDRDELLYVARHAPPAELILADYAFTTPAIPFALNEKARSMVVMHDLLSVRAERFMDAGLNDSVETLDRFSEAHLLSQADAVVAIQDIEAKQVRQLLPRHTVILSPVACPSVLEAKPGSNKSVLFVGSNTAPNVIGLRWFLQAAWPKILAHIPDCELTVVGSVASQFPEGAAQTRFLGVVGDLSPYYDAAGVVISPLPVGSGLKVKVIEALGCGKAIVATSVSVEGIAKDVLAAVTVCDEPSQWGESVTALLLDDRLRQRKASDALRQFKKVYSEDECFRELLSYLDTDAANPTYAFERQTPRGSTQSYGVSAP